MKIRYTISTAIIGAVIAGGVLDGLNDDERMYTLAADINARHKAYSLHTVDYSWRIISIPYNCLYPDFGDPGECVECLLTVGEL